MSDQREGRRQASYSCVGEVMVERIAFREHFLQPGETIVLHPAAGELGGGVVNISWYLSQLGNFVRMVTVVGALEFDELSVWAAGASIDVSGVLVAAGVSDQLAAVVTRESHGSFYVPCLLPAGAEKRIVENCVETDVLILSGGRHREFRESFARLAERWSGGLKVFSPSYAVFEYQRDELEQLMRTCDICVWNEEENRFVIGVVGGGSAERVVDLGSAVLVTRGIRGAQLFSEGECVQVESPEFGEGVFLGAGDAFLAGFLHLYGRVSAEAALRFGARLGSEVVRSGRIRTPIDRRRLEEELSTRFSREFPESE